MGRYARCVGARWLEPNNPEEFEDTIMSSWINEEEKTVRWPVKISVIRALMEGADPKPHWKTFKLVKIKVQSGKLLILLIIFAL